MMIQIHRGIQQIGGCITEIKSSSGTRILIDLGHNLQEQSQGMDEYDTPSNLSDLLDDVSAIIYTHNHGDHIGFFDKVSDNIQQYLGEMAKEVLSNVLNETLQKATHAQKKPFVKEIMHKISCLKSFCTYRSAQKFNINDISITPFFVSHSAADAYMLLIECDGKRVLHTGDIREHGFLGKGLEPTIKKRIPDVDVLIIEGTMLTRDDDNTKSESEIQTEMRNLMKQYKNVFVLCSSTNFDRLAGLHKANATFKGRPFVCDIYQNEQFKTLTKYYGQHSDLYVIKDAIEISLKKENLLKKMAQNGFTMIIRDNRTFRKWIYNLTSLLNSEQTVLVYSQYIGYLKEHPKLQEFVKMCGCKMKYVHTSGHATRKTLAKICNMINPTTGIIPIHREAGSNFSSLDISAELKNIVITNSVIKNGVNIKIN